ncbi:MAG: DUF1456 family protein [Myxococcales bacterium]|nr:DUF1456 family protein [Myxococcales bacterium]
MPHNDLLRSLRYTLNVNDDGVIAIFALAGKTADREFVEGILMRDEDEGAIECGDIVATAFLDGLITQRRGTRDGAPDGTPDSVRRAAAPARAARLTNNLILRKLRIAFSLKDDDVKRVFALGEFPLSLSEISAFSRREDHPNWRPCGDQALRHFLRGLPRALSHPA